MDRGFKGNIEFICFEDKAFDALIDRLMDRFQDELAKKERDWIDGAEALKMLGITSASSLQILRDGGKIRYSKPSKKVILYDRRSIIEYLEQNAVEKYG